MQYLRKLLRFRISDSGRNALFAAGVAASLMGLSLLVVLDRGREDGENPYEYDLTPYKKIDPALVRYREVETIPVPLTELTAVAVDAEGRILVAGKGEKGVVLALDAQGNTAWKRAFERTPRCVTAGENGGIFVGFADRVQVMRTNKEEGTTWNPLGEKALIMSITAGPKDVYVADGGQRLIWRFDPAGTLKGVFGKKDPAKGELGFLIPGLSFDVALGPKGRLWAVDPGRHTVQHRTLEGKILSSFGRYGLEIDRFCGCCSPLHIAVRSDGAVVTSEKGLCRVKVHDEKGALLCVVAGPDQFDDGTVNIDLAVDPNDRIIIMDPKRKQIRIFEEKERQE